MQLSMLDSSNKCKHSERFLRRLKRCLSDSAYEVRLVSFKALEKFLKSLKSEKDNSGGYFSLWSPGRGQWDWLKKKKSMDKPSLR